MIAAVSSGGAPGYENLGGYFLGGGSAVRQPVGGVPSALAPSARMETRPGQQPPGPQATIPTSSQKPGNREPNQRIPYARFQLEWQENQGCQDDLHTGDVCFVHRLSQAMGHGYNRNIKVTSLPVLNQMLSAPVAGVTTLDVGGDPTLLARMQEARVQHYRGLLARVQGSVVAPGMDAEHAIDPSEDSPEVQSAKRQLQAAKAAPPQMGTEVRDCDWRAVSMLSDWSLDGVVINVDDEVDISDRYYPKTGRDDGVLVNTCIQGPTPMRNTPPGADVYREGGKCVTQHVDDNLQIMDKVFVGLFGIQEDYPMANRTVGTRIRFEYRLFTGCQYSRAAVEKDFTGLPIGNAKGLVDIDQLWGAWRVGSVMDTHLSRDQERMMQINVCVEWWSLQMLEDQFGLGAPAAAVRP